MTHLKSFTSLEQSKVLAKILPHESADMYYRDWKRMTKDIRIAYVGMAGKEDLPCWSLAALINVLPKNIKSPFGEINPFVGQINIKDYRCVYLDGDWGSNVQTFANNPIDACYEMILKLHEQNLI